MRRQTASLVLLAVATLVAAVSQGERARAGLRPSAQHARPTCECGRSCVEELDRVTAAPSSAAVGLEARGRWTRRTLPTWVPPVATTNRTCFVISAYLVHRYHASALMLMLFSVRRWHPRSRVLLVDTLYIDTLS